MSLTFVTEEEIAQAMKRLATFLYGPKGIGKTTAAVSGPSPIAYMNADAPGRLRFARRTFPEKDIREVRLRGRGAPNLPPTARKTMEEFYLYLADGNGVETAVLDPMGGIYDLVLDDIGGQHPTLQHRGDANAYLERYVLALLELPIHVVLVAHDLGYKVTTDPVNGDVYELFPFCGSQSNPALAKKLMRPMDVVAYCGVKVELDEKGNERKVRLAQLFDAGGRQGADGTGVIANEDGSAELDLTAWVAANAAADATNEKEEKK